MRKLVVYIVVALASCPALAIQDYYSEHAKTTLDIYSHILSIDSSKNLGNVPKVAEYLAGVLISAGFSADDVKVVPFKNTASLIAKFRGDGSGKKAILLLGHMDVVEAFDNDWERPPFQLTDDGTYFYGRGAKDNKFGVAQITSTFIRLKKEGFVPNRDLIIVFSGDEESEMQTARAIIAGQKDIAQADFALNSDAGGGFLSAEGAPLIYLIQSAEKTYVTWEIAARNPGGHSSRPRPDNAIYDLAEAVTKIRHYKFPVRWNDMTLAYLRETGKQLGGELGMAMVRFSENPKNKEAQAILETEPTYVGTTRTTCVATMLQAGHAENALPQSATATINCRVFPGDLVSEVEAALKAVIHNDEILFKQLTAVVESPVSEMRAEVLAAVSKAVHKRYRGLKVTTYMESGGTDGTFYRVAGVPTWGVSSVFMNPEENFAHGLNERVPIKAFYDALDHWSIILKELASH